MNPLFSISRTLLLRLSRASAIGAAVQRTGWGRRAVHRFVAGNTIDDAVAAVRAGAGALALTEGSGVDPHSLADIAPVALAMSPTHRHEIDGARNDADSQRQPDDAGTLRDR